MTKFSPYVDFQYKLSTMWFKIKKSKCNIYIIDVKKLTKFATNFHLRLKANLRCIWNSPCQSTCTSNCDKNQFWRWLSSGFQVKFARFQFCYMGHHVKHLHQTQHPTHFVYSTFMVTFIFFIWLSFNDSSFIFAHHSIFTLGLNWINQTNIEIWLAKWTLNLHI